MLLELSVQDFAIIDRLRVEFEPGLNALTGETGAGKSILIDAVGAVLGERVGSDVVRTGAKRALIEATFDVSALLSRPDVAAALDEHGVEPEEGILILARDVAASGRSAARVNGRAATAGTLARIGALLVDIHGQSEHLSLLRPAEHLEVLDRFAGTLTDRSAVATFADELRTVRSTMQTITANQRQRAQRVDLLQFQVEEIGAAGIQEGEEEGLLADRAVLINAERLMTEAAAVHALLAGDDALPTDVLPALGALQQAGRQLADIATLDASVQSLAARCEEVLYLLEDIVAESRAYRDRIEADPARLAVVEERLDLLRTLKRKYGTTVREVLAHAEEARRDLAELTGEGVDIDALQNREAELLDRLGHQAEALSRRRQEAGERLSAAVVASIAELNMGRADFTVAIRHDRDDHGVPVQGPDGETRRLAYDRTGIDRVEFLLAPNTGEALKPLARVASGGETARLMLALKSILAGADATPTLVFDEVDVGVGGRSGQVVGEKLWGLADSHQVLVITHLAQIAAFATAHFRIAKGEQAGRVISQVDRIDDAERVDELAAMLDGVPVTDAARGNALQMLNRVATWKDRAGARP